MNPLAAVALSLIAQAAPPQPLPYEPPAQDVQDAQHRGPEPQETIAVRPQKAQGPSFFSRATKAVSRAVERLWEKDEPHATDGNMASLNGDVDGALKHYDEAQKHIAPNSEQAAALAFDRSTALLKGQPDQAAKAFEEAQSAQTSSDASLRAKAAYNAGVALEAQGKPDEAIKAYANALSLDSEDVDSKVNLELLLQEHEKKQKQSAGQQDKDKKEQPQKNKSEQQQQAQGKDEKKDQSKPDDKKDQKGDDKDQQAKDQQQKSDQQKQAEADQKKDEKGQQGQEQQQPDQQGEKKKEEAKQEQASVGRSEAQRLLDAARAGEKNLQMWRFGKKADQRKSRTAAEKDW